MSGGPRARERAGRCFPGSAGPDAELGEGASDAAGAAVAGPGDVDGDGADDILVGAPGAASGGGSAYLYFGGGF